MRRRRSANRPASTGSSTDLLRDDYFSGSPEINERLVIEFYDFIMGRKSIAKYLNPWMFKRDKSRGRVTELRAAYGDACWRCGHQMTFGLLAARRRATVEHLLARSQGGTSEWQNIRLCHSGCNRHLGTFPPDQKLRMRTTHAREAVPEYVSRPSCSTEDRRKPSVV